MVALRQLGPGLTSLSVLLGLLGLFGPSLFVRGEAVDPLLIGFGPISLWGKPLSSRSVAALGERWRAIQCSRTTVVCPLVEKQH